VNEQPGKGIDMRRTLATIAIVIATLAAASGAHAQVFYPHPGARPVPDSSPALGAAAGFGDDMFRLAGFVRLNASQRSDIGFELIYDDIDSGPASDDSGRFGGGIDWKLLVVEQDDDRRPVDAAVQVGAGMLDASNYKLFRFPIGAMASRTFPLSDNRSVTPYIGGYLLVDFIHVDNAGSDSDVDVEFRMGGSVEVVDRANFFAALHLGNGTMFFLGFSASL
jgi:hypothetical protein